MLVESFDWRKFYFFSFVLKLHDSSWTFQILRQSIDTKLPVVNYLFKPVQAFDLKKSTDKTLINVVGFTFKLS